ncbi:single-stranded DNA-binding protein [Planctomycetota bacterium]
MANFNKVLLMGNLTRDPQLSYLPSQTAVVEFGLATNRKWTGQDGTAREETCFVDCRAFGKMAENINKYLNKGRPVFIEGRLTFDTWTAQDGTKRSKHRVTIQNFQFLPRGQGTDNSNASREQTTAQSQTQPEEGEDDIPF